MDSHIKYNAFISYSQSSDGKLAPALQHALHRIMQPWHRLNKSKLNIFRDATSLGEHTKLTDAIIDGLDQSASFILMASIKSAESYWVQLELNHFIEKCRKSEIDPAERIIIVVTEGNIEWSHEKKDWNWGNTNVLPEQLKGVFKSVPLYVDFREIKKPDSIDLKGSIFKQGVILISAFLLKKKPSEIDSIESRERKKQVVYLWSMVAVLATLLCAAIILTVVLDETNDELNSTNNKLDTTNSKLISTNEDLLNAQDSIQTVNGVLEDAQDSIKVVNGELINAKDSILNVNTELTKAEDSIRNVNLVLIDAQDSIRNVNSDLSEAQDSISSVNFSLNVERGIFEGENLALNSLNEQHELESKCSLALKSYEIFLMYYDSSNYLHTQKIPTIYSALQDAFVSYRKIEHAKQNTSPINQIVKVSEEGEPVFLTSYPNKKWYANSATVINDSHLKIESLHNRTILITDLNKDESPTELHGFSRILSASLYHGKLLTTHTNGEVTLWKDISKMPDVIYHHSKLYDWVGWIDENLYLLANKSNVLLRSLMNSENLDSIQLHKQAATFGLSPDKHFLLVGGTTGELWFHRIVKSEGTSKLSKDGVSIEYSKENVKVYGEVVNAAISLIKFDVSGKMFAVVTSSGSLILFTSDLDTETFVELFYKNYDKAIVDLEFGTEDLVHLAFDQSIESWPIMMDGLYSNLHHSFTEQLTKSK